jgi:hypothetical protein
MPGYPNFQAGTSVHLDFRQKTTSIQDVVFNKSDIIGMPPVIGNTGVACGAGGNA